MPRSPNPATTNGPGKAHDAKTPANAPFNRYRPVASSSCDTELRIALPPDQRWMVAAYGE